MKQSDKLIEIKQIMHELKSMPYGIERNNKSLAPSVHHFEILVDKLIETTLQLEDCDSVEIVHCLHSIKYNQIRELHINKAHSFERFGINEEMNDIVNSIEMHIGKLLK